MVYLWHSWWIVMPRKDNLLDTDKLTLSTNPLIVERLERLVHTGYFGKNAAEAAERLVAKTLEEMDRDHRLPEKPV